MHEVIPGALWIGHIGDASDLKSLHQAGVRALVDLALNETPPPLSRELVYLRVPLVDGAGNAPALLRAAIATTRLLLEEGLPTLVYCSAGMSRAPAIAAMALSRLWQRSPEECLVQIATGFAHDVSTSLWRELLDVANTEDGSSGVRPSVP